MSDPGQGHPGRARDRWGDLYAADCPTREILDHLTSRWATLVLVLLRDGTHRFSQLAKRIGGVSEKMLAHTLRLLEADGLVLRVVYPTKPPSVEYSLTSIGEEVAARMQALTDWIEDNLSRVMLHREKGRIAGKPGRSKKLETTTPP